MGILRPNIQIAFKNAKIVLHLVKHKVVLHLVTQFFPFNLKAEISRKTTFPSSSCDLKTQKTSLESHFAGWDIHRDRFSYERHEREDAGSTPPEK